ncbi:MAG: class I SAM-dependent methyltransferase [Cyanobacteria bacterium J06643_4]
MTEAIPRASQLVQFWDNSATSREFRHPVPQAVINGYFPPKAKILDIGCGQGRLTKKLSDMGFAVSGTDTSTGMLAQAQKSAPECDFCRCQNNQLPWENDVFDVAIAITLFTSVPSDKEQRQIISELKRVLKHDGLLFISDMPLQWTHRYLERYQRGAKRYGQYGVFDLADGGVVRHHDLGYFMQLLDGFTPLVLETHPIVTMNGNSAQAIRYVGKLDKK